MNKPVVSARDAVADIADGASIAIGGFGVIQGWPISLIVALRDRGARDLTLIFNSPGLGPLSPQILAENGQVRKLVASYATYPQLRTPVETLIRDGKLELEMVPQGTLVERLRAGGAGLAGFYTPTGVGTDLAAGKEERVFDGRRFLLETALRPDFAFVRAQAADETGNLVFRGGARNFNPVFATAARVTIAEANEIVRAGDLDPEHVVTPGIFVDRLVRTEHPLDVAGLLELSRRHGSQRELDRRAVEGVPRGLTPELMAYKVASLLRPGEYVNLGIGLPTLVSNFLDPDRQVVLHSENGILGCGPLAAAGQEDIDLYNASAQLITILPGASFFHSADAFAMSRGGRLTTVVLGAFQVAENGDLANWNIPQTGVGGVGGAMDLAAGGARVIAIAFHTERDGRPKLLRRCTYPLTGTGCVRTVVTELAVIDIDADGFLLREIAPGVRVDDVRRLTGAPLREAVDLHEM